jgi:hypothetical protein
LISADVDLEEVAQVTYGHETRGFDHMMRIPHAKGINDVLQRSVPRCLRREIATIVKEDSAAGIDSRGAE